MSLRSLRALPLLLAGLGLAWGQESGAGVPLPVPQRRYSEATLASDYSRTMDHVLSKNFVEWLLARRERSSPDAVAPLRREAEPQDAAPGGSRLDSGAREFLERLWKNRERQSFPALEASEGLREFLEQEFLTWLMSGELCRAMTS